MLVCALTVALPCRADTVDGVRPATPSVIAPRGGVMMLPLTAKRPGSDWPRTLEVKLADGRELVADVVWLQLRRAAAPPTSWTADPRRLTLRAVERADDTSGRLDSVAGEGPYLLVRLPDDGNGPLRIENHQIIAQWHDAPWNDPLRDAAALAPDGALTLEAAPDRPDPNSPFEYWRWVLLADRLGLRPPAPPGDDVQQRAAEHYAVLWRLAMQRLATLSPRIASECRNLLTRTAIDRSRTAATWIADPQQISTLLAALLDFSRSDQQALSAAVAWQDQQPSIMLWPEDVSGDDIRLALTSLRDDAITLTFAWQGADHAASTLQLEPGIIAHVSIDRLPMQPPSVLGPDRERAGAQGSGNREHPSPATGQRGVIRDGRDAEPVSQVLRVTAGNTQIDVPCGPRIVDARPPGVTFLPLAAPLTLADVQANRALPVPLERATLVQIRRLGGRWEAFFDCRRLYQQEQTLDRDAVRTFDDLRGVEAVTLLIGRGDAGENINKANVNADNGNARAAAIWLTVPEHDWPAVIQGQTHPDLQVHKRSFGDRWHCRIVLPEQWFSAGQANPGLVGFIRSHADNQQLETGPMSSPAWLPSPGRSALDLLHWDDLPAAEP